MHFNHLYEDIKAHAIECYPQESCGIVIDNEYVPCTNVAPDPCANFKIAQKELDQHPSPEAVAHSHPDGNYYPSESDMRGQECSDIPWAICVTNGDKAAEPFWFGDEVAMEPLVGRGFRHGVTDCYGLIRDYYRKERQIKLPVFPREWGWWMKGGDLYRNGFQKAGFERVDDLEPGDVFLAQVGSPVPNHGGIYLGNGLILHHVSSRKGYDPSRISRREPFGRWQKNVTHCLRYVGNG